MSAVLQLRGVTKSFRIPESGSPEMTLRDRILRLFNPRRTKRLSVLHGIDLDLAEGETLGIMGRNGCGKSTLLKIVAGIYLPDEGEVIRNGAITPILELGVGWNPELDAIDNMELLGTAMGMTLDEIRGAAASMIDFAGLEGFERLELKHYSSGMAARLAYAVAFRAVREVLILDEIFAVGDAAFKARCSERAEQLRREGHSILLVSHNPGDIAGFCDRALLLEGGLVVAEGSGDEIAERYLEMLAGEA